MGGVGTRTHTRARVDTRTHARTHTHARAHTPARTRAHTRTHTHKQAGPRGPRERAGAHQPVTNEKRSAKVQPEESHLKLSRGISFEVDARQPLELEFSDLQRRG